MRIVIETRDSMAEAERIAVSLHFLQILLKKGCKQNDCSV